MATLNIGGKKVKVGDEFLRMTPEQQNAAVEEIAGQIGAQPGGQSPEMQAAMADASQRSQSLNPMPQQPQRPDLMGATSAALGGMVQGIPVLGPMVQGASDAIIGGGAALTGGDYGDTVRGLQDRRAELAAANPIADVAGQVAGNIGSMMGVAAIPGGAEGLGMAGKFLPRVLNSAVSGAGVSAADTMAKGGSPELVVGNTLLSGGIGAAIPIVGGALGLAARGIGSKVAPKIGAALNPAEEASRRTGQVILRDLQADPAAVLNAADEGVARSANIPLLNVDRGGETTRGLARSVANQSPEARSIITKAADERFETQGLRAIDMVKRVAGGSVDDLAYQQSVRDTARLVNSPRYKAAESAPGAAAIWSPQIRQLMQSDLFRAAIGAAESRGTDKAAIAGVKAVRNPFTFGANGQIGLKTMPDGSRALPSLQFWDQVKRNLDGMIDGAMRGAKPDRTKVADLTAIKNMLVSELDAAVPQYQVARRGAATFFDAEDALDAGKKFATQPKAIPEATQAFSKFSAPEKQAFATGYASEIIDRIRATRDRVNVINQIFGSQASREMNELVFGAAKARQIEAYVRVEALADRIRGALGNSTTARQLVELGIGTGVGGAAGYGLSGGNFGAALQGAAIGAGGKGLQMLGKRIDAKVMENIARLLTSKDPADLQRAIANATLSPQWMQALERMERALGAPVRGLALQQVGQ